MDWMHACSHAGRSRPSMHARGRVHPCAHRWQQPHPNVRIALACSSPPLTLCVAVGCSLAPEPRPRDGCTRSCMETTAPVCGSRFKLRTVAVSPAAAARRPMSPCSLATLTPDVLQTQSTALVAASTCSLSSLPALRAASSATASCDICAWSTLMSSFGGIQQDC